MARGKAGTNACHQELQKVSRGLLYPSESDHPIRAVLWTRGEVGAAELDVDRLRALLKQDSDTPVETRSVEEFFGPVTTVQAWHGEEEKQTVCRFQELQQTVQECLSEVRVFRTCGPTAELVLVGKTASGDFAGLVTRVVET